MSIPTSSHKHYELQQQIAVTTVAGVNKLWGRMGAEFDSSWQAIRSDVIELTRVGRMAAAVSSVGYTEAVLLETGQKAAPVGLLVPAAFVVSAPDGNPIESLLDSAVVKSKVAVRGGASTAEALKSGGSWLSGALLTAIADTSRSVVSTDIVQRPGLTGYVRMLNAPSCSRCVILAGKWFKWNEGFQRHPRCDCRHIPASENVGGDFRTDPYDYFNSLDEKAQGQVFGKREAAAIREYGADIYKVMNVKTRALKFPGNDGFIPYDKRMIGSADRIIKHGGGNREITLANLKYHGYITGPQVAGGNVRGNIFEGFGELGKGGKARAASDAVSLARRTGVRDPLNRYTMTAAERRLYDAHYMLNASVTRGVVPPSIGMNTADMYSQIKRTSPEIIASQQAWLDKQVAKLPDQPQSVWTLAKALGLL